MRRDTYSFNSLKIHRVEGTSLAISVDIPPETSISTVIRFYEVDEVEQTYTWIGVRVIPVLLYITLKSDRKAISEVINKFMDLHPIHEHLLRH